MNQAALTLSHVRRLPFVATWFYDNLIGPRLLVRIPVPVGARWTAPRA